MKMKDLWVSEEEIKKEAKENERLMIKKEMREKAEALIVSRIAEEYLLSTEVSEEEKDLFSNLFDDYQTNKEYLIGDKFNYNNIVYEVIQPHTSLDSWKPSEVPALYNLYYQTSTSDGTDVIPEWSQPLGGHDAYNTGDLVFFEDTVWESQVDSNVWAPGAYGWVKI